MNGENLGWWVPVLVVGVPPLLLLLLHLLGRMEAWMLEPDERAAAVHSLLAQAEGPDEVEAGVIRLLTGVHGGQRRVEGQPLHDVAGRRFRLRSPQGRPAAAPSRRRAS